MVVDRIQYFKFFFFVVIILMVVTNVFAQDWAKPLIKNLHRIDLRDLGYQQVNEIPANSSAITSLLTSKDGKIYGATSGDNAYLFIFDPTMNKVKHLGKIKGHGGIHHALVQDNGDFIYIGTGKNIFEEITISHGGTGEEYIDKTLWMDIKNQYQNYEGGHLYRYTPSVSDDKVKLADLECDVLDLGIPVPNNSIYALTVSVNREEIYGLTYPDGHFFIYTISQNKFKDLGEIDKRIVFHGPERHWRSLPRSLISDDSGNVYMSGTDGMLIYYNPHLEKIVTTDLRIPGDYYPAQFFSDYPVVEYFTKDDEGLIYGGTSDGYLFSFDVRKMRLINLGKVHSERRLRAMTTGKDGKIYLIAGERVSARPCQFYCYDPAGGGFENLGMVIVDRSPYYYWRGYQFDCMTTGADGTIYLGESERRSHLFLFIP